MGQGQPREIIWTILVVLTYTMLHIKFQGHRSIGSGEEDFLRFLPYMGMVAILVMWPEPFEQLFVPPIPGGYIWNLVTIGTVVSEEKSFEIVDGRRRTTDDDGRRTTTDDGACLYYKLPRSLRLRWAKKKKVENLGDDQGKQLCHFHFPPFPMGSTLEVKKFLLLGQKLAKTFFKGYFGTAS